MAQLTKSQQEEVKKEVDKQTAKIEKRLSKQLLKKTETLSAEYRKQLSTTLIAAFGLVMALSWQTVIRKAVDGLPKWSFVERYPALADLYSALIITLVATLAILAITHQMKKAETTK